MHPAIFLDRDGVIIENRPHYVRSWEDVQIFPEALRALAGMSSSAYKFVIITNQSCIGRGLVSWEAAGEINRRLLDEIRLAGGRIDRVYVCPHTPQDGCDCRKPRPGMILQAARELHLDLRRSILIGDALSDLQAGLAAGVGEVALVSTGRGKDQARLEEIKQLERYHHFDTLAAALQALAQPAR